MVPIRSKVQLVVIQPTTFCNIDCKYCYLPDRLTAKRMNPEILENSYRFLLERPDLLEDGFRILWHASEPLALPIAFYESALARWQELALNSAHAEHCFQTNATLINQRWCDLIQRWNVNIGVSIDGPQWMHDSNRVDKSGVGTFERVMRGIEMLKRNRIEFDVISVLTNQVLDYPDEIWHFFRNLGARSVAFNSDEIQGVNTSSSMLRVDSVSRFETFFRRLLELREQESPALLPIRELDGLLTGIQKWGHVTLRSQEAVRIAVINIGWNGDISSFSPFLLGIKERRYGDFVFGNVMKDTIHTVLKNPLFAAMFEEVEAGIEKCQARCEYFGICHGGTPATKFFEHGAFDRAETLACRLRIKAIGNVAMECLEERRGIVPDKRVPISTRALNLRGMDLVSRAISRVVVAGLSRDAKL